MTQTGLLIGIPIAIILAYPFVMRLLAEAAQAGRLRMVALEEQLLTSGRLDARYQRLVRGMVSDCCDSWEVVRFSVWFVRFGTRWIFGLVNTKLPRLDDESRKLMDEFVGLHMRSLAAANPIFFLVILIEMAIFGAIAVPLEFIRGASRLDLWEITTHSSAFARQQA